MFIRDVVLIVEVKIELLLQCTHVEVRWHVRFVAKCGYRCTLLYASGFP